MTSIALTNANNTNDVYGVVVTDNPSEVFKIIEEVKTNDGWTLDDIFIALTECKWVLDIIEIDHYVAI